MDELTRDKATPPRVRFLLRDVLDVRTAGWHTSANQTALKAAPMKLEEVREKQALDEQAALSPKKRTFGQGKQLGSSDAWRRTNRGNDDSKDPRQRTNVCNDARSSLARLSAIVAKPSVSSWAPSNARPDEKHTCSKEQTSHKAVSPSNVSMCEKQNAPQVNMPLVASVGGFDLVVFRRELASTLTKLATDRHVPSAVQSIRALQVPIELQTDQFTDILSRILEERRGIVRRCELAFAAGLMVSDQSPFDKKACLDGIALFFADVYEEMCAEIPRLPAIMKSEFVPTMLGAFSASELNAILPEEMRIP